MSSTPRDLRKNSMREPKLYLSQTLMTLRPRWNKLSKILKKLRRTARKTSSLLKRNLRKLIKKTKLKKVKLKKKNLIITKILCLTVKLMENLSSTQSKKSLSQPKSKQTSTPKSTLGRLCPNWVKMKLWPTQIKLMKI